MSDYDDILDAALEMREPPGIGDNNPPDPLASVDPEHLIDPDIILAVLERNYPALLARRDELIEGAEEWVKAHTQDGGGEPVIVDDEDAGGAANQRKMLASFASTTGEAEETRKRVKEPVIAAGRIIDGWFNGTLKEKPLALDLTLGTAATRYLAVRAERVRLARLAEAARANEAAARLAEQAERARSEEAKADLYSRAVEAEEKAAAAEALAAAPADTKVRSDLGATTFRRSNWKFQVTDMKAFVAAVAAGTVQINWLMPNESVINASIKGKNGLRDVPGLRIWDDGRAQTR